MLIKVEAYKCEWCGRLFQHEHEHTIECRYDPKARTCESCGFSGKLKRDCDRNATGVYCPRADKVFIYPHDKYCPDYVKTEHYEAYTK